MMLVVVATLLLAASRAWSGASQPGEFDAARTTAGAACALCDEASDFTGHAMRSHGHRLHCHELSTPSVAVGASDLRTIEIPAAATFPAPPIPQAIPVTRSVSLCVAAVGPPRSILFGNFRS